MKKFATRWTGLNQFRIGWSYDTAASKLVNASLYLGSLSLYYYRPNKPAGYLRRLNSHIWRVQYYGVPDYASFGRKFHRIDLCLGHFFRKSYSNNAADIAKRKFRAIHDTSVLLGGMEALGTYLDAVKENGFHREAAELLGDSMMEELETKLYAKDDGGY